MLGWLVFGEVPDTPTVIGSLILAAAGYTSVQLEGRREKAQAAADAKTLQSDAARGEKKQDPEAAIKTLL